MGLLKLFHYVVVVCVQLMLKLQHKKLQLWKLDEEKGLVSKFNDAIIGLKGDNILSAYVGDDSMLKPIAIDLNAKSSYEYGLEGNECPDEPESSPDGSFHT